MTLLDIAPPEDHAGMLDYARTHRGVERLGLQRARPRRHLCKDGSILDVEVTSDDLMLGGRHCRVCLCLDVATAAVTAGFTGLWESLAGAIAGLA